MTLSDLRTLAVVAFALALAAGGAASLGGSASAGVQDATRIDSCTTIDESGTYVLTKDIENGGKTRISGACFEITADGVTFDGDGHTIDGRGVSHTKGVAVRGAQNVEVRNFAVNDWHEGVLVEGGSARVRDVNASQNAYGIRLENAAGSTVTDNNVADNLIGIYVDSENVTLTDNTLSENEIGVKRPSGPAANESPASANSSAVRASAVGI